MKRIITRTALAEEIRKILLSAVYIKHPLRIE